MYFLFVTKILLTIFAAILIPVYWKNYGPTNFLWLSDISLFLTLFALWVNYSLFTSIAMVGIFPFELAWNLDFFLHLFTGKNLIHIADYMFERKYSLFLKSLSLFHVILPPLWIFLLYKFGYNQNAFLYSIFLIWIILILTYLFTDPKKNINWVFMPKINHWKISEFIWLIILMIGFPIFVFLPMHVILKRIF